jgi:hypothetical protein
VSWVTLEILWKSPKGKSRDLDGHHSTLSALHLAVTVGEEFHRKRGGAWLSRGLEEGVAEVLVHFSPGHRNEE